MFNERAPARVRSVTKKSVRPKNWSPRTVFVNKMVRLDKKNRPRNKILVPLGRMRRRSTSFRRMQWRLFRNSFWADRLYRDMANARRQQLRTARQLRTAQSPKERDARLQQLRTAREQTIATESTEERQTRLQQLRSAQQQRIAAETPEGIEARLQQLSTAQQQDCSATGLLPNRQRGERPGVNGLPLRHRRKETPVFNKLQLLVNRRLRQNRLRGPS